MRTGTVEVLQLMGEAGSATHVQLSIASDVVGNPPAGVALRATLLETGSGGEVLEVSNNGVFDEGVETLSGLPSEAGKTWLVTDLTEVPGVTFAPGSTLDYVSFGPHLTFIALPESTPPPPPPEPAP